MVGSNLSAGMNKMISMTELVVLLGLAMMMMISEPAQVEGFFTGGRTPMGYQPYCDSGDCPSGPYENGCPVCGQLHYGATTTLLQCFCFNSKKQLQDSSFIRSAQKCNKISVNSAGKIYCASKKKKKRGLRQEEEEVSEDEPQIQEGSEMNVENEGSQNITIASVQMEADSSLVDFVFNCAGGNCPNGGYQNYCARCIANSNPKPPNDPRPALACRCFDEEGVMKAQTSTMWNFQLCPKIIAQGGALQCVGAGKAEGVRVYTGRRLGEHESRNLEAFEVLESGEIIIPTL